MEGNLEQNSISAGRYRSKGNKRVVYAYLKCAQNNPKEIGDYRQNVSYLLTLGHNSP